MSFTELQQTKSRMLSALKAEGKIPANTPYKYTSIFLNRVQPDPDNQRFFPAKIISDIDARKFIARNLNKNDLMAMYEATGFVLVGKGCIINCVPKTNQLYDELKRNIESIMQFSKNIAASEMLQAPTIYPIEGGYRLLTGHRRFFAMIFAFGCDAAAHFKVYSEKPVMSKTRQFQENASREGLSQIGKLNAFLAAKDEIEAISEAARQLGQKVPTVAEKAELLGISMGAFDNYNVLTRYASVIAAYSDGLKYPFVKTKKIVLEVEAEFREANDKRVFNIEDKRAINKRIEALLSGDKPVVKRTRNEVVNVRPIKTPGIIKRLFTENITQVITDIDWESLDWDDQQQMQKVVAHVLDVLESEVAGEQPPNLSKVSLV